jgi:hypothetical protein
MVSRAPQRGEGWGKANWAAAGRIMAWARMIKRKAKKVVANFFMVVFFSKLNQSEPP